VLTAAALVVLVGWVTLLSAMLGWVADGIDHRRVGRVAAQVSVTDSVHRALGAVVAPTVAKHRGRSWTVTMGLAPRDLGLAGRLAEVASEALGRGPGGVRIVIVPRPEA